MVSLLLASAPAGLFAQDDQPLAPPQHRGSLFLSAHPSLFTGHAPYDVFEGHALPPEPEFLPADAYGPAPPRPIFPEDNDERPLQMATYPFEPHNAGDITPDIPELHSPPAVDFHATPPSAPLIQQPTGLIWKDRGVTTTTVPAGGGNLGMTTLDLRAMTYWSQFPGFQISPRFSFHLLNGPGQPDLPARLYDFGAEGTVYIPFRESWAFFGGLGPSMFSDFENTTGDAFRITGRAIVFYQHSPTLKFTGGFLYLDRDDIVALPVGGVTYTPHNDLKIEAVFPRPKVAWRYFDDGDRTRWIYLAGELGGGSWAIERVSGVNDVVSYRDYRLIAGCEQIRADGYVCVFEAGFVFQRQIEYTSNVGNADQSPSGMIRFGAEF